MAIRYDHTLDPTLDLSINPFLEPPPPRPITALSHRMCGLLVQAAESCDPDNPYTNTALYTVWKKYVLEDQHRSTSKSSFGTMVRRFHRVLEHGEAMPVLPLNKAGQYQLDLTHVAVGQAYNRTLVAEESPRPAPRVLPPSKKRVRPTGEAEPSPVLAGAGGPATVRTSKKRVSHTDKMCAILVQATEEWGYGAAPQDTAYEAWVKEYTLQVETEPSFQSFYNLIKQMRANEATPFAKRLSTATSHMTYIIKEANARLIRGCSYIGQYGYPYPRYTPPSKRLHT